MHDNADLGRLRLSIELCAVYWHFLLAVWLVLFGLLFSGNDNLGTLLAICGLR
jgi:cytochrome c oxidase subunit 3